MINRATLTASRVRLCASLLFVFAGGLAGCTNNPESQRTPGTLIDDTALSFVIEREIRASDEGYEGAHLSVTVFDGLVLLLGQVPTEALRANAVRVTESLYKVDPGNVHNHLSVDGPISMLSRTNDSVLTTEVKARLLVAANVPGGKIKVKTENGIIYLLGRVTREEAEQAALETQKAFGVRQIIKVFDYLDGPEPT